MTSKPKLKSTSKTSTCNKYISNEKGSFFKGVSVDELNIGTYITKSEKGWIYLTKPSHFYRGTRTFLLYGIRDQGKYDVDVLKQVKSTSQDLTLIEKRVIELLREINPPLFIEVSKVDNSIIGTLNAFKRGTLVNLDNIPWEFKALLLNNTVIEFTNGIYNCVNVLQSLPELKTLVWIINNHEVEVDEMEDEIEIVYDSDLGG